MRKEKILGIFFIFVIGIISLSVGFLIVWAASGTNDGTMTNMDSGDIVDSSFSDGGTIKSLDFDGTDDYVDMGNDTSLQITNNLSVVGWVECGSQQEYDVIYSKYYGGGGERGFMIRSHSPTTFGYRKINLWMSDDGSADSAHIKDWYTTDNVLPSSGWAQVVFTFASGDVKLYVDGTEITSFTKGTNAAITSLHNANTSFIIGQTADVVSGRSWPGELVNYSIWDTSVLTQADVTALYANGGGVDPQSITPSDGANLVSSWLWNTSLTHPTIPDNANIAPTLTAISPVQTAGPTVTVTTTIADADSDVTSLTTEYSLDNSTWVTASTTVVAVAGGEGDGVVTSTPGTISDIDTDNDGSVDLTIEWTVGTDIPLTDDTTVYFRLTPNDGTTDGSVVTSGAFAVDTKPPTNPGNLTVNTTSTNSIILNYGVTTTDTNFTKYIIYYNNHPVITPSDLSLTSSTDPNLGNINFNDASTTTISGLAPSAQFYFNIWAYESWGNSQPALAEVSVWTLAVPPGVATVSNINTSTLTVALDSNGNSPATTFSIKEVNSGLYIQADGTLSTTTVWQDMATWGLVNVVGLTSNNIYQFETYAKNMDDVVAGVGPASATVYTLANAP